MFSIVWALCFQKLLHDHFEVEKKIQEVSTKVTIVAGLLKIFKLQNEQFPDCR